MSTGTPFAAPLGKRLVAESIDLIVLFFVWVGLMDLLHAKAIDAHEIFFLMLVIYVAYQAFLMQLWSGQTLGKRLADIAVVSTVDGRAPGKLICVCRPLARSVVFALLAFYTKDLDDSSIVALFGLLISMEMTIVAGLMTHQSFADLICRTLVVNLPPLQPHRAPAGPMYSKSDAEFGVPPKRVK
jgi:uncharacterized RDD family membrane protein YckC